jgi:hypothetical protein
MQAIKLIRNLALAVALAGLSVGAVQAAQDAAGDGKAAEFQAAIEKAEAARKKAASVGGEWRDTGKLIKQAQAAAKKEDYSTALKLAHEAFRQGELGYQQAVSQENAGFPSYMR